MLRTFFTHVQSKIKQRNFSLIAVLCFFVIFMSFGRSAEAWSVSDLASSILNIGTTAILKMIAAILEGIDQILVGIIAWLGRFISWAFEASTSSELYNHIDFITTLWTFLRDFVNSLFIIGILYLAFKTALSSTNDPSKFFSSNSKVIGNMLIAAVLINFSMFFVKVGIDASNVITRGIYYRIETTTSNGDKLYGPIPGIIDGLKLATLSGDGLGGIEVSKRILVDIGGIAFSLYIIWMFACLAFLLFGRMLFFILVMAVSPIWFLGFAFSGVNSGGKKAFSWAEKLKSDYINQLTWPPMFVGITYIVIKYIEAMNTTGAVASSSKSLGDFFLGESGAFAFVINIGIIVYALHFAVSFSLKKGREGMGGKFEGFVQKSAGFAFSGAQTAVRIGVGGAAGGLLLSGAKLAQKRGLGRTSRALNYTGNKARDLNINPITAENRLARTMGRLAGGAGVKAENFASKGRVGGVEFNTGTRKTFDKFGAGLRTRTAESLKGDVKARLDALDDKKMAESSGKKASALDVSSGVAAGMGVSLVTGISQSDLLGKQGEEVRKSLVKDVLKKFERDPLKAKAILNTEFTRGGVNYLETEEGKKELGKELKDFNKKVESLEIQKSVKEAAKSEKSGALKTARDTVARFNNTPPTATADRAIFDSAKAVVESFDKAKQGFKKIGEDEFLKLSADEIDSFRGDLSKKHIQMLSKMLSDEAKKAEMKPEEIDKLNAMAKNIRIESPTSDAAKLLSNMAATGVSGFDQDKIRIIDAIKTATGADAIKGLISSMQNPELQDVIFDKDARAKIDSGLLASMPVAALRGALKRQEEESSPEVDAFFIERQKEIADLRQNHDSSKVAALAAEADTTKHPKIEREYARLKKQYDAALDALGKAGYRT
jgi:hypothetical protein